MKQDYWIIICLIVLVLVLLFVMVSMYIVIQDDKEELRMLHKRINNLLCDYEDNTTELAEVLQEYHEQICNSQISAIHIPKVVNDDW